MEQRLIELETRLAFQEQAMEELSDALAAQQRQLDTMEQRCARLTTLLAKMLPLLEGLEGEA